MSQIKSTKVSHIRVTPYVSTLRTQSLFAVSFARVNTVRSYSFNRIPKVRNTFLEANRDVDVWESSMAEFRARAKLYVSERQR